MMSLLIVNGTYTYFCLKNGSIPALARWLSGLEHGPVHQGCGIDLRSGHTPIRW